MNLYEFKNSINLHKDTRLKFGVKIDDQIRKIFDQGVRPWWVSGKVEGTPWDNTWGDLFVVMSDVLKEVVDE